MCWSKDQYDVLLALTGGCSSDRVIYAPGGWGPLLFSRDAGVRHTRLIILGDGRTLALWGAAT